MVSRGGSWGVGDGRLVERAGRAKSRRGGVPERPKGADCKSAALSATKVRILPPPTIGRAGVAQLVEHQPSKLRVTGSSPVARFVCAHARVAQSVERVLGKDEVTGSIPVASLRTDAVNEHSRSYGQGQV